MLIRSYTLAVLALCVLAAALPAQNLVTNGEFDDDLTAWRTVANGGGEVAISVVGDAGLSGANAARIENVAAGTDPFNTGLAQLVEVDVPSGARYRITFQARAEAARDIVFEYKLGTQSLYYETQSLTPEAQTFTFEFERTAAEPIELLFFTGVETPAVFLDAVTLEELEPDAPIDDVTPASYDQVAIGGAGYVTGVYYHPTTPGLLYMRTDVGGPFRYDYDLGEWIPLFDDFTVDEENYFGINALALAPSDDSVVYVAADKAEYFAGPSDVLVSRDRGATWEPTGLDERFFGFGDFFSKSFGPAIAVDPADADRVYAGTINNGLWYKPGREAAWEQVEGILSGIENIGVKSVLFGPGGSLYVGVYGVGAFVRPSPDAAFVALADGPTSIWEIDVDGEGRVFAAAEDGLYVRGLDGTWTTTRAGEQFASVSVHPDGSGKVVALETLEGAGQGDILYSEDSGATWEVKEYVREDFPAWYPPFFWSNAGSSITFDPFEEAAVSYADFFAVWHTADISAQPSTWSTYSEGHEETYVTDLMTPPAGDRLYAALADALGFSWADHVTESPSRTLVGEYDFNDDPFLNNGSSLDYCAQQPSAKVFAASINNFGGQGYVLRSDDEFATFETLIAPGAMGRVAMSADDPDNMVVFTTGAESQVYFTTDGGQSWTPSSGAPSGISDGFFRARDPLAADRVEPGTFYLYEQAGRIHVSTDGGATFSLATSSLPTNVSFDGYEIETRPGAGGEVWASLDEAGLHRSVDGGQTFAKVGGIDRSLTFGFGRGADVEGGDPTAPAPTAVYVYGESDGREGLFYSANSGESWTEVALEINWANNPRALKADLQEFGRVYIGSDGSGILFVTLDSAGTSAVRHSPSSPYHGLRVAPNPAGERVRIAFDSERAFAGELTWFTVAGRRLGTRQLEVAAGANTFELALAGFPKGTLVGVLRGAGGTSVVRIVREVD